jgi:hypothetical protein
MYAALAYHVINKVEEEWLVIMENVPLSDKVTLFLDYYFQQMMENQNVPIEMWNVNKCQLRNNKAVEVWNSKLNSIRRKEQPHFFLQVQKVKEETELVSWQLKSKEPGDLRQKRTKTSVKEDERVRYL